MTQWTERIAKCKLDMLKRHGVANGRILECSIEIVRGSVSQFQSSEVKHFLRRTLDLDLADPVLSSKETLDDTGGKDTGAVL